MSTSVSTFLYEFANSVISKLPVMYSATYIFIIATNHKCSKAKIFLLLTAFFGVTIISAGLRYLNTNIGLISSYLLFIVAITLIIKNNIKTTISMSIVVIGISYCIRFISIIFIAPISYFLGINSNSIILTSVICLIQLLLTYFLMKLKRLKNGLSFFNDINNFGIGLLLSGFVIIALITISNDMLSANSSFIIIFIGLCICCIGAIIWIKTSITRQYRKRLQEKSNEYYNTILAEKDGIIDELSSSNAFLSKIVHRDNHLMTSLQYSLKEFSNCNNKQKQEQILSELLTLAKERNNLVLKEQLENKVLTSTGNSIIDGALLNMYIKASAHKINFDLIVTADVNYLINHFLSQTELETLLCDHIKNSIIAIESLENQNGNILTSISMTNGIYEISVKDNGIEFDINTLQKLGNERVTTHQENGGSGIGFMTSFDTLKKSNASVIISEYEPNKPFTKSVSFRFDGKGEFIINSYRNKILNKKITRTDITFSNEL